MTDFFSLFGGISRVVISTQSSVLVEIFPFFFLSKIICQCHLVRVKPWSLSWNSLTFVLFICIPLLSILRVSYKENCCCFFLLWVLCIQSIVSRSFLVILRYSLLFFKLFLSPLFVLWCPLPIFRGTYDFLFPQNLLILSWLDSSIPSFFFYSPFSIIHMTHFSMHNFVPIYYSYIMAEHYWYFTPWEFFTSALPDGFPLKFEWQQVFSSLQDSSSYTGWSQ